MATVEEIVKKYVELRDRKAELAKKHSEEMAPLNNDMGVIENYLMHKMNETGVDSFKTKAGTAFRSVSSSCQMADAGQFKNFVFRPVVDGIHNYLLASGYAIRDMDLEVMANIIRDQAMWDMVDFRAGKKGITEYMENESTAVPGVTVNTVATVNIRRA